MPLTDRMPTVAKLVAAAGFGAIGWIGSQMIRPLMPPNTDFGWFDVVNVVLGLLCGWIVTGSRLGRGYPEGISAGLTGLGALVFWALFVQSFNEMIERALERRYTGPVEGLIALFEIGVEFGVVLLNGTLIGVLVGGAMFVGLIAERMSHRWS